MSKKHKHIRPGLPAVIVFDGEPGTGKSRTRTIVYDFLKKHGYATGLYADEENKIYFGMPQLPS